MKIINHITKHRWYYLPGLAIFMSVFGLVKNLLASNALLLGPQTYYHIGLASPTPFSWIIQQLPTTVLPLLALSISVSVIILLLSVRGVNPKLVTLTALIYCISPTFIFNANSLSLYQYNIVLILLGFILLQRSSYYAIIPYILVAATDFFSGLLSSMLIATYWIYTKDKKNLYIALISMGMSIILWIGGITQPLLNFTQESPKIAGIADLGAQQGISFFVVLLTIFGLSILWKEKKFLPAYLCMLTLGIAYIFSGNVVTYLALVTSCISALFLLKIIESKWSQPQLQTFTILLIVLSISFSSISYLDRINDIGPSAQTQTTLHWISKNTPAEVKVFAPPNQAYYIRYFANRQPFTYPHEGQDKSNQILETLSIMDLFPILEKEEISIFYFPPDIKKFLPPNQGLLAVLQNERFKLVYSSQEHQVWVFSQTK